ncbi:MAG: secretin N-terminal domain-containing protein [Planctomycetaceae bacterium]
MNPRRLRLLGVGLTAITCSLSLWHAEFVSAEVKLFGKKAGKPATAQPIAVEQAAQQAAANALTADEMPASADGQTGPTGKIGDKQVKLNYFSKTWSDVMRDVAQQSNRQLVMDKIPPGRFSRSDWSRYSVTDALKILNRELEPKGFRILERGQYLDLVFMRDARSEYARPIVGTPESANLAAAPVEKSGTRNSPANNRGTNDSTAEMPGSKRPQRDPFLQQAVFEEQEEDDEEALDLSEPPRRWVAVTLKHQSARNVSRSLYQAFEEDAELIDQGPNGLPGFVVWRDAPSMSRDATSRLSKSAPKRVARFAVGVDTKGDRLLLDGPPTEVATIKGLIAKLDSVSNVGDSSVRLVATKRDARQVAQTLNSAVQQLAQARAAESKEDTELAQAETPATPKAKKNAKKKTESKPAAPTNPADPKQPRDDAEMETPANKAKQPAISGPLRGDVSVEELGDVLILRGNEQDVEAVMRLIDEIGKMLAGSVPDVNVRPLKHVDSDSLAELLTTVYERLNRSRGRSSTDQTQQIVVIAIGKPNAVMVLASERDMPTVDMLIEKLDQPVDPTNEFEVFRLRYAVASQVLTAIDNFFGGGTSGGTGGQAATPGQGTSSSRSSAGGLRGRVKVISDSRTNSVIVQARPRDLEEVRRLIEELDQAGSQAVNQIRLIPLKNAVADDMATLLNLAIQSVISPPQQARATQGGGQAQGGGAGGGQVDQKLREAKSAVLQLLESEDGESMVESGILADIRINSDPHTNSLIVTAPEESLALIQALVKRFDKPAAMVAEIKHFTLQNADASSIVTMLNTLFNNQQQGQGQRGGGQQNQQLGIQLSGAEDASSQLIPLKFSTDIRTNSIIAVGGAEALSVVEAIILRLDASDARQRTMSVFRLKNSPAAEVATALTLFLQGQQNLAAQGNQDLISDVEQLERQIVVIAEANSNSLLISATPRYLKDITAMVERIDMAQQQVMIQALIVEVTLDNTDEFGIELGFQDSILFDRSTVSSVTNITQSSIFNTNSTTTSVTPGTGATNTTTTITPQALTTSTPISTGVPGFLFNNLPFGNNVSAPNPNRVGSQGLSNFSLGRLNSDLGYGGLVMSAGSESVNVLLRALSANRKIEILSRPQIRTLDNQLGRINVGQSVPVITSINTTALGQVNPVPQYKDAGIILEVTPRITPDDRIVMQVGAQRSKYDLKNGVVLSTTASGNPITSPVLDITQVVTTISVDNEQTVVLGGMIQKLDDTITRKVPWLGDIPIIGNAFRYDAHNFRRVEVLVFLTPRIVKNATVNEIIKQVEAERLHYTEADAESLHGPLFGCPAPLDGSTPPVYAPGEMWTAPRNSTLPTPPAPMPNDSVSPPRVLPVPPMSDESSGGVQGASYQRINGTVPLNRTVPRPTKPTKKPTILDRFSRAAP